MSKALARFHLCAWRHPLPVGVAGRCIGQTDVVIDRRKAKRLAHRIRKHARQHQWARVIHTSALQRCKLVGQYLKRWGWRHVVHADLAEMSFGAWEGQAWDDIAVADINAWCADFLHARPGGGESLQACFARLESWVARHAAKADVDTPILIVAHAGCMQVWQWLASGCALPEQASQWPRPPGYGEQWMSARVNASDETQ